MECVLLPPPPASFPLVSVSICPDWSPGPGITQVSIDTRLYEEEDADDDGSRDQGVSRVTGSGVTDSVVVSDWTTPSPALDNPNGVQTVGGASLSLALPLDSPHASSVDQAPSASSILLDQQRLGYPQDCTQIQWERLGRRRLRVCASQDRAATPVPLSIPISIHATATGGSSTHAADDLHLSDGPRLGRHRPIPADGAPPTAGATVGPLPEPVILTKSNAAHLPDWLAAGSTVASSWLCDSSLQPDTQPVNWTRVFLVWTFLCLLGAYRHMRRTHGRTTDLKMT